MATNNFQELYTAYGKRQRIAIYAGDDRGNYFGFIGIISKFDLDQALTEAVKASIEIIPSRGKWIPQWKTDTTTTTNGEEPRDLSDQPFSLGLDCVLKYSLEIGDTPNPGSAKILRMQDVSWSDSLETADVTDRGAGGYKQSAPTLRAVTLSGTLLYDATTA